MSDDTERSISLVIILVMVGLVVWFFVFPFLQALIVSVHGNIIH
mgnify:CR=1 FL=1